MELIYCGNKEIREYIRFCKNVYKNDSNYRDSLTSILKSILYKRSEFCKRTDVRPIMVKDSSKILAVASFIATKDLPDVLQLAFFEAEPNSQRAVDLIVAEAKKTARQKGLKKVLIGLNGHVNYGLGILANNFDKVTCFGNSYNPPYYVEYFKKYSPKEYNLISYLTDMDRFNLDRRSKLITRIMEKFTFRTADLSNLDKEVDIYTRLNNQCFKDHPFYWERTPKEDYELFSQFKHFIKGESLIIAEKDGEPIGFMLWYPDFNQLINPGREIGIDTFIKNKFMAHKINKFKIAETGVLPQYQGMGVSVGLFYKCMELTKNRYKWCESGWILDSNIKSKGFGVKWADREYKHYKVFEVKV